MRLARETCFEAHVVPPSTATDCLGTVAFRVLVVVPVSGGETVPAVAIEGVPVFVIDFQRIAGISAVATHFQSIFVVALVADPEGPVLGRVPQIGRALLHLHPQSVRLDSSCHDDTEHNVIKSTKPQSVSLRFGELVDFSKTKPEVGAGGSKPDLVFRPRAIPVEIVAEVLVKDDPVEHGHDEDRVRHFRDRYADCAVLCHKVCKTTSADNVKS